MKFLTLPFAHIQQAETAMASARSLSRLSGAIASVDGIVAGQGRALARLSGEAAKQLLINGAGRSTARLLAGAVQDGTMVGAVRSRSRLISSASATGTVYPLPSSQTLIVWHDAGLGVTGADPVTNWDDQSGNGRSIAYTSNVTVSPATYNGNPALRFYGASPSPTPPTTPTSNAWTIIVVCTTAVDSTWAYGNAANRQIRVKRGGAQAMSFYNGSTDRISSTLLSDASNLNIYSWLYDSANLALKMYQNGASVFNGAINTASIEWGGMETSSFSRPNGDLAERMFWNGIITTAEHNAMGSAIASKYGISWTTIA